jgi:hypothetical protein
MRLSIAKSRLNFSTVALRQWIRIPTTTLTIAELPEYIRRADKLMSLAERIDVVN